MNPNGLSKLTREQLEAIVTTVVSHNSSEGKPIQFNKKYLSYVSEISDCVMVTEDDDTISLHIRIKSFKDLTPRR